MKKLFLAALLGGAALPACAEPVLPDADPALWVVKDADTTVYLFGTVHILDGKKAWFNDEVKAAYDASDTVVLEAIMPTDPAKVQATVMKLATSDGAKPLSERLAPETAKKLTEELAKLGVPANAFDSLDPWFVATALATIQFQKKGITPEHGVERILTEAARADGKELGELESFEWQMNLFESIPDDLQVAMLKSALEQLGEFDTMSETMMTAWANGDIDALAALMNESLKETPELGKIMLADRNARWAEWIDARLDTPGTTFVAVGAGHLGGKDSVQAMLAAKGIESERVE